MKNLTVKIVFAALASMLLLSGCAPKEEKLPYSSVMASLSEANREQVFNTAIFYLNSTEADSYVRKQLKEEELRIFEKIDTETAKIIIPDEKALAVKIAFRHKDPKFSSRIANLYAVELISMTMQINARDKLSQIDNLIEKIKNWEGSIDSMNEKLENMLIQREKQNFQYARAKKVYKQMKDASTAEDKELYDGLLAEYETLRVGARSLFSPAQYKSLQFKRNAATKEMEKCVNLMYKLMNDVSLDMPKITQVAYAAERTQMTISPKNEN